MSDSTPSQAAAGSAQAGGAGVQGEVAQALQRAHQGYYEAVHRAQSDLQKDYVQAVLSYLEAVQRERDKWNQGSAAGALKELWDAYNQHNPQSAADAYRKYLMACFDQQASANKTLTDAATSYAQTTRAAWDKLQNEVQQQNTSLAGALRDLMLRTDIRPADIPTLATLYHGAQTLSAASAPAAKSG